MEKSAIRVLVVDDYELWRRYVVATLGKNPELRVVGEAKDGRDAVQITKVLQPDLVLLDVGLPALNGIEVARQVRELSPNSKILFLSENRSFDIVEAAFRAGAIGYVVKSDAASELSPALDAVLQNKRFVSSTVRKADFTQSLAAEPRRIPVTLSADEMNWGAARLHEVIF